MAYATLTQLKSSLSIATSDTTQDDYLEDILARVTDWIDEYTSRSWQGPITVIDEEYDLPTNNEGVFFLRRGDVQTVSAVKVGSQFAPGTYKTLTVNSDYVFNKSGRVIVPQYSSAWVQGQFGSFMTPVGPLSSYGALLISYTYGLSVPTRTVEHACVDIAAGLYTNQASQGVKREKVGDYLIEYQDADMMQAMAGTDQLKALDHLKLRHV